MFSTVVIYRDAPELLRRALRSVQRQLYPPKEVIVIECARHGDAPFADLTKGCDSGIEIVCLEALGADDAEARWLGIQRARGELITFLDARDELLPSAYVNMLNLFEHRPNLEVAYGRSVVRHEGGCFTPSEGMCQPHGDVLESIVKRDLVISPSTFVTRRRTLMERTFAGDDPVRDDWQEFLVRTAMETSFGCVHEDVAIVAHDTLSSHGDNPVDHARLLGRLDEILRRQLGDRVVDEARAICEFQVGKECWRNGNTGRSLEHLRRATTLDQHRLRYWLLRGVVGSRHLLDRHLKRAS
ncbi:Glycosyl transferase family 2 [Planctomycetes bacterium Pan216]|uniref:Glycosyl transferase family 2 n=1 Tax=Kolteria novifilia TaxID=2527975 RepID=A0A518B881_9BACT|nr:Glycosyl transferase family 2 [Planctomycetes bacterium Pan216]